MMDKEHGFTYPLTLAVLILFFIIFSFRIEQLVTERKLSHETKTILLEEYYFHTTVKKIETMLQSGESLPTKGAFTYEKGTMTYQSETPIGTVQKINFTLRLHSGETFIGRGNIDIKTKKIVKWIEL